jgi:hypothetical protein
VVATRDDSRNREISAQDVRRRRGRQEARPWSTGGRGVRAHDDAGTTVVA